jgi:hypothetical protein
MSNVPDRKSDADATVNNAAAALACVYLSSGSLIVTALAAGVVVAIVLSRRF